VTDRPDQPTPPPGRLRLVVLFGGASAEHDISCVTASSVLQAVDPARYDIVPIGITRDGRWVRNDDAIASLTQGAAALPGQLEVVGTEIEQHQAVTSDDVDVATVVLPLLRQIALAPRPRAILKWEGIVNDPIGVLCAVVTYEYLRHAEQGAPVVAAMLAVAGAALVAALVGFAIAFALGWLLP